MMMKVSAFFGLAAAAGLTAVAGASVPRASPDPSTCASKLSQVLTDPKLPSLQCLAPEALNNVVTQAAQNASSAVVIGAIDTWLAGMCGVGFCRPDMVEADEFATGTCSGIADVYGGIADNVTAAIKLYYPAVREMMCLKNSAANNTFCMTQYLAQAGSTVSLNAANPLDIIKGLISASFNMGCNECTKAAAQIVTKIAPFNDSSLTASCGSDFTATLNSTPVGITQSAVDVEFGTKNGAAALAPTTALLLFTISVLFTLL